MGTLEWLPRSTRRNVKLPILSGLNILPSLHQSCSLVQRRRLHHGPVVHRGAKFLKTSFEGRYFGKLQNRVTTMTRGMQSKSEDNIDGETPSVLNGLDGIVSFRASNSAGMSLFPFSGLACFGILGMETKKSRYLATAQNSSHQSAPDFSGSLISTRRQPPKGIQGQV